MPQILRLSGPGEHSLGGTVVVFDAEGLATSSDPEVLALVRQFPQIFVVRDAPDEEQEGHDEAAAPTHTAATLERLTVSELRELALHAGLSRISSLNKADLIAALLPPQA